MAEYSYDAMGRRVEKKDCVNAANTRRYYYSNNWQVLNEYDGSDNYKAVYVYGNYIDEVLVRGSAEGICNYIHDHLYSPAALTDTNGDVVERYEYDERKDLHKSFINRKKSEPLSRFA